MIKEILESNDLAAPTIKSLETLVKKLEKGLNKKSKGVDAWDEMGDMLNGPYHDLPSIFMDASDARDLGKMAGKYSKDKYDLADMKDAEGWTDEEMDTWADHLYTISGDPEGVWNLLNPDGSERIISILNNAINSIKSI